MKTTKFSDCHNFDENYKIFLIVTTLMKITKFFWLLQFLLRMQYLLVCLSWIDQNFALMFIFEPRGFKTLKNTFKAVRQGMFCASFTHFDREFELE